MKILKLISTFFITFLLITGCITAYNKGDYKIKLLLGPVNNQQLNKEIISKTIETQLKRLELYGIPKKNIKTEIENNNILIEINEINNPERIEKILTQQGKIEFWETYNLPEVFEYFYNANKKLRELNYTIKKNTVTNDTSEKDSTDDNLLLNDNIDFLSEDNNVSSISGEKDDLKKFEKENPLFALLIPYIDNQNQPIESASVGYSDFKDTSEINNIFKMTQIKIIFPHSMILAWESKPMNTYNEEEKKEEKYYNLIALKAKRTGKPSLEGNVIVNVREEKNAITGTWYILMSMNEIGSNKWAIITKENIGKQIAIVIDGYVYSAPNVNSEIKGGNSSISGNFTQEEARDLAIMLDTKSLPYKLKILEKEIIKVK